RRHLGAPSSGTPVTSIQSASVVSRSGPPSSSGSNHAGRAGSDGGARRRQITATATRRPAMAAPTPRRRNGGGPPPRPPTGCRAMPTGPIPAVTFNKLDAATYPGAVAVRTTGPGATTMANDPNEPDTVSATGVKVPAAVRAIITPGIGSPEFASRTVPV